jgi:hypothetical protein
LRRRCRGDREIAEPQEPVTRLDIRSYTDTTRKHGQKRHDVLNHLMLGSPWRPPAQAFSP